MISSSVLYFPLFFLPFHDIRSLIFSCFIKKSLRHGTNRSATMSWRRRRREIIISRSIVNLLWEAISLRRPGETRVSQENEKGERRRKKNVKAGSLLLPSSPSCLTLGERNKFYTILPFSSSLSLCLLLPPFSLLILITSRLLEPLFSVSTVTKTFRHNVIRCSWTERYYNSTNYEFTMSGIIPPCRRAKLWRQERTRLETEKEKKLEKE